jgi:lipid-binding SYLF domain-containing protein
MNPNRSLALVGCALATAALAACSSSSTAKTTQTTAAKVEAARADALERLDKSTELITQLGDQVPATLANGTQCVVAIPSLVKAGVVIGGESGKGFATCQTATGWSAPAPIRVSGGTFGAQVGGQSADVLALVMSQRGERGLMSNEFKVGTDASATAGPVGAAAGTNVGTNSDVISYSRSQGLFAGVTLNGTKIKPDTDSIDALYGTGQQVSTILRGQVPAPAGESAQRFISAVHSKFGMGRGAMPRSSL